MCVYVQGATEKRAIIRTVMNSNTVST